jgi:hypothetical protein
MAGARDRVKCAGEQLAHIQLDQSRQLAAAKGDLGASLRRGHFFQAGMRSGGGAGCIRRPLARWYRTALIIATRHPRPVSAAIVCCILAHKSRRERLKLLSFNYGEGDIALYRGSSNGLEPTILVAAEETSLGSVERFNTNMRSKPSLTPTGPRAPSH